VQFADKNVDVSSIFFLKHFRFSNLLMFALFKASERKMVPRNAFIYQPISSALYFCIKYQFTMNRFKFPDDSKVLGYMSGNLEPIHDEFILKFFNFLSQKKTLKFRPKSPPVFGFKMLQKSPFVTSNLKNLWFEVMDRVFGIFSGRMRIIFCTEYQRSPLGIS
jgi:hypothetical protein